MDDLQYLEEVRQRIIGIVERQGAVPTSVVEMLWTIISAPYILRYIARRNGISLEILTDLANHRDVNIRWAVHENPTVSPDIKNKLEQQADIQELMRKEEKDKEETMRWEERWHRRG
jgi:hypothetical protein